MDRRSTRQQGPDRDAFRGRESYDEARAQGGRAWSRGWGGAAFDPFRRTRQEGYEAEYFGAGEGRGAGAGSRRYREVGEGLIGGGDSGAYGGDRESRDYLGGALDRGDYGEDLLDEGEPHAGPIREIPWRPEAMPGRGWSRERRLAGRGDQDRYAFAGERFGHDGGYGAGDRFRHDGGYGSATGGAFAGRGPKGYRRSDERIQEEINERLMRDSWIDASEISVRVEDGVVRLDGAVDERRAKHRAEDLVAAVMGVREVENRLRVADGSGDGERREAGKPTGANGGRGGRAAQGGRGRESANAARPQ